MFHSGTTNGKYILMLSTNYHTRILEEKYDASIIFLLYKPILYRQELLSQISYPGWKERFEKPNTPYGEDVIE